MSVVQMLLNNIQISFCHSDKPLSYKNQSIEFTGFYILGISIMKGLIMSNVLFFTRTS